MIRTRVGYAGGTTVNPTYRRIGDHAETIQIDYDPTVTSYQAMLDVFFDSHNACARPWSRQYMSAIFTHDAEQRKLAETAAQKVALTRGQPVKSLIEPLDRFYLAEDYHQKYQLRSRKPIVAELLKIYPKLEDFVNSPTATRLNGYLAGYGSATQLRAELPAFGLTTESAERVRAMTRGLR